MLAENDVNWWNQLSAKEKASLSVVDIENVERYKLDIFYVHLMHWIGTDIAQDKKTDQAQIQGMDEALQKLYSSKGVFALETTDEVAQSLLDAKVGSVAELKQLLFIVEALQSRERNAIVNLLRKQFKIGEAPNAAKNAEEKAHDSLTDDRNLLWIDRIESFHTDLDGNVLFAFGAAHLHSNKGILKLLEERNFIITKLNFDSNDSDMKDL